MTESGTFKSININDTQKKELHMEGKGTVLYLYALSRDQITATALATKMYDQKQVKILLNQLLFDFNTHHQMLGTNQ